MKVRGPGRALPAAPPPEAARLRPGAFDRRPAGRRRPLAAAAGAVPGRSAPCWVNRETVGQHRLESPIKACSWARSVPRFRSPAAGNPWFVMFFKEPSRSSSSTHWRNAIHRVDSPTVFDAPDQPFRPVAEVEDDVSLGREIGRDGAGETSACSAIRAPWSGCSHPRQTAGAPRETIVSRSWSSALAQAVCGDGEHRPRLAAILVDRSFAVVVIILARLPPSPWSSMSDLLARLARSITGHWKTALLIAIASGDRDRHPSARPARRRQNFDARDRKPAGIRSLHRAQPGPAGVDATVVFNATEGSVDQPARKQAIEESLKEIKATGRAHGQQPFSEKAGARSRRTARSPMSTCDTTLTSAM